MLGYEIKEKTADEKYYKLYLTKEKYFAHCQKLIKAAALYNQGNSDFIIKAERSDLLADEINSYLLKQKF